MQDKREIARPVDVLVATPSGDGGQGGIDRLMDSLRHELDRQGRTDVRVTFAPTRGAGHIGLAPFYLLGFCVRMLLARMTGRLGVVHINLASRGSTYRKLIVAGTARLFRIPYMLHLHGGDYPHFWNDQPSWRNRRIQKMFAGAARILVLGRVWRNFVARKAPEAAGRIVVLPNATPRPTLPHVGGGELVHILFLGRINDAKGVPQLGEALAQMLNLPGWRATLAGDGAVELARRRAIELGLAERVTIPGWVNSARVAELIAGADILVLPSLMENLPISIIEAMASGLAIVATAVGAVEDIVTDGKTGLLVPPGDVDALTVALRRLVADGDLRQRLGAAALAVHRERLDIELYAATLAGLWTSAAR